MRYILCVLLLAALLASGRATHLASDSPDAVLNRVPSVDELGVPAVAIRRLNDQAAMGRRAMLKDGDGCPSSGKRSYKACDVGPYQLCCRANCDCNYEADGSMGYPPCKCPGSGK